MVPVLDFTQEWTDGLEGYNRLFNRSVVYSQLEDGKVVPLDDRVRRRQRPRHRQGPRLIEACCRSGRPRRRPDRRYDTARSMSLQYLARTAFLSGLPTGVSGSAST